MFLDMLASNSFKFLRPPTNKILIRKLTEIFDCLEGNKKTPCTQSKLLRCPMLNFRFQAKQKTKEN